MVDDVDGGKILAQSYVDAARANMKMWLLESGALINSFASPATGQHAHCHTSGSGFGKDRDYVYDGSRWLPSPNFIRHIDLPFPPVLAMYADGGAGSPTIAQEQGYINLQTGGTAGNDAYINPGLTVRVRRDRAFQFGMLLDIPSVPGVEIEVGVSDSNNPTAFMTSAANHATIVADPSTSANWITRTANGTTQNSTTSSVAVTAGRHWVVIHNNESRIDFIVDAAFVGSTTTTLPTATTELVPYVFVQTEGGAASLRYLGGRLIVDAV